MSDVRRWAFQVSLDGDRVVCSQINCGEDSNAVLLIDERTQFVLASDFDTLETERDGLEKECIAAKDDRNYQCKQRQAAEKYAGRSETELGKSRARVAELEKALQWIIVDACHKAPEQAVEIVTRAVATARAALEVKP